MRAATFTASLLCLFARANGTGAGGIRGVEDSIATLHHLDLEGAYKLGCWTDKKSDRVMTHKTTSNSMTHDWCRDYCSSQATDDFVPRYFGLQFGKECWCGDANTDYSKHGWEGRVCSTTVDCTGDSDYSDFCGGFNGIDVFEYETDDPWIYEGCFKDNRNDRVLERQFTSFSNSVESCSEACNFRRPDGYFALQFGTECWCAGAEIAENFDRHGTASCDMACMGNLGQICGDFFAFSLFRWGPA